jgi:hypothetical protein
MKKSQTKKQQRFVDEWNSLYPVGTPVTRYKLVNPCAEPEQTETRSEAWLMHGGIPMVMVDGIAGGVLLQSVKPLDK